MTGPCKEPGGKPYCRRGGGPGDALARGNYFFWLLAVMAVALAVRCYHITGPIDDNHSFRQTQTAGLIRHYARDGVDLLYPTMITLGDPGYVVLEFPAYQALAAGLYRVFSINIIYARLLTIFFGLVSVFFVYRISRKFLDERAAVFAAFFYAFMPLNIFFQRTPLPDPLAVMLSLIAADFLIGGARGRVAFLAAGTLAACLGMVMKSPIVAPVYLPLVYVVWAEGRDRPAALARLAASAAVPLVLLILWQHHANSVNGTFFAADAYPFDRLRDSVMVRLKPLNFWYFGDLAQRLDFRSYYRIGCFVVKQVLAVAGVVFLVVGSRVLLAQRKGWFFFLWLLANGITIMVFFNLYVVHNYYQLFNAPALAALCGAGAAKLSSGVRKRPRVYTAAVLLLACFFVLGLRTAKRNLFGQEHTFVPAGEFIGAQTGQGAMIATSSPERDAWNPVLMYHADRRGFNVPHDDITPEMVSYLKLRNIRYIAVVDAAGREFPALQGSLVVAENGRVRIYGFYLLQ